MVLMITSGSHGFFGGNNEIKLLNLIRDYFPRMKDALARGKKSWGRQETYIFRYPNLT